MLCAGSLMSMSLGVGANFSNWGPSLAVVRNGVARRFPAVMLVISLSATRSKIVTIKVRTLDAHQKLPFPAGSDAQARWAHRGATQVWNTPETYQLTCTRIRT